MWTFIPPDTRVDAHLHVHREGMRCVLQLPQPLVEGHSQAMAFIPWHFWPRHGWPHWAHFCSWKATTQRSTGMGRCSAQELRELNQLWGSGRTLTAPATTALHSCLPHFRFPSEAISGHKIYLFEKHHQLPFCLGIRTNCKPKSFGNPLAAYLVSLRRPSLCSLQGEQATKMGIPNRPKSIAVMC